MATESEMKEKFWKAIKSDRTVMLGPDQQRAHAQPMTAQLDGDVEHGPIYFFTAKDTDLVRQIGERGAAMLHFASKGHDIFACVSGELIADNDPAKIDRLWSPFVAAWFEGGKSDPKLQLLRFDPEEAQIWLNENSLFAGVKLLLGADPKKDFADKTAEVRLS